MKCAEIVELVDQLAHGELNEEEAAAVRAHIETCAGCREQAAAAELLKRRAAELPHSLLPERDLWPGIRDRIESRKLVRLDKSRLRQLTWSQVMGIAAALVIATALVAGYALQQGAAPSQQAGLEPGESGPARSVLTTLDASDAGFQQVREQLLDALKRDSDLLPPDTRRVFMEGLLAIDRSITDIRVALAENPDDTRLTRLLIATRQQEIELLRRAVRLSQST
jgi:hypothetical protein